jgi:hypothetical protein
MLLYISDELTTWYSFHHEDVMLPVDEHFLDICRYCTYNKIIVDNDIKFYASLLRCIFPLHFRFHRLALKCLLVIVLVILKNRVVFDNRLLTTEFSIR